MLKLLIAKAPGTYNYHLALNVYHRIEDSRIIIVIEISLVMKKETCKNGEGPKRKYFIQIETGNVDCFATTLSVWHLVRK
jgi:hypothetical protein